MAATWLALGIACWGDRGGWVQVTIGNASVRAELAWTPEDRARGLSGRPRLDPAEAMLFLFPRAERLGFWMPDMHFDLDLVWIRGDRIVDITHGVSRAEPERIHRPRREADRVLEVLAGTAARHGWALGDPVHFEPPQLPEPR